MSKLVLIRGLPGSGKSTLAKSMARAVDGFHFEADQYFVDSEGVYTWDRNKIGDAHRWCQEQTSKYLTIGCDVFVANTFTTIKELKPYFQIAKPMGIVPVVITCNNNWGNIHNVPEDTLIAMRKRFEHNIDSLFNSEGNYD